MADVNKKYVDYAGLTKYDELIKGHITAEVATEATRATGVEEGLQDAIDVLNGDATTAGSVAKAVKDLDDTLADVAKSGDAEDVSYDNTESGLTATDVQGAIDEVAAASAGGVSSKTVYITEESGGSGAEYSKKYSIYQGASGSAQDPVAAEKLVDINIPKDMVVEDGSVVDIVYVAADDTLHEGSASGADVTEEIMGSVTPTESDAGKYIKLTIANSAANHLWIKATDLVDIYTTEQGATEIQLTIDSNNVISAEVVAVAATKVTHGGTTVEAALTTLEGDESTEGSVAKAEADAKAYADGLVADLDTSTDVAIATHDSSTGVVTIKGSMAETDGVIEEGTADDIKFTPVSNSEIQALFPSTSA